jgi:hypothetical protein
MTCDGTDDWLTVDILSNVNDTVKASFAAWLKPRILTGTQTIFSQTIAVGCSVHRVTLLKQGDDLIVDVYHSNSVIRRGRINDMLSTDWQFITWEFDGGAATEALACLITLDKVVQTLTFSDVGGTPGDMPANLVQPTGDWAIGVVVKATDVQPFDGQIGPNVYQADNQFTVQQRSDLYDFQNPT